VQGTSESRWAKRTTVRLRPEVPKPTSVAEHQQKAGREGIVAGININQHLTIGDQKVLWMKITKMRTIVKEVKVSPNHFIWVDYMFGYKR
jgi:hypothetical protein